jgi:hypothetical protein
LGTRYTWRRPTANAPCRIGVPDSGVNGADLGVQSIQFWAVIVANHVGYLLVVAII